MRKAFFLSARQGCGHKRLNAKNQKKKKKNCIKEAKQQIHGEVGGKKIKIKWKKKIVMTIGNDAGGLHEKVKWTVDLLTWWFKY